MGDGVGAVFCVKRARRRRQWGTERSVQTKGQPGVAYSYVVLGANEQFYKGKSMTNFV